MTATRLLALAVVAGALLAGGAHGKKAPAIHSVVPRAGSMAGGTRVRCLRARVWLWRVCGAR